MAAGFPTKTTYLDGDVWSAADINSTNGTINYIDPTSATDKQVLTRDAASAGKMKWADSPANIATTTGDILYASSANTLARLPVGSTNQVLTVSSGIPSWANAGGSMTLIGSAVSTSGLTTYTWSSIPATYKNLVIVGSTLGGATAGDLRLRVNGITAASSYFTLYMQGSTTAVNSFNSTYYLISATATADVPTFQTTIVNYANSTAEAKPIFSVSASNKGNAYQTLGGGSAYNGTTGVGTINSVTIFPSAGTWNAGTLWLYGVN